MVVLFIKFTSFEITDTTLLKVIGSTAKPVVSLNGSSLNRPCDLNLSAGHPI